LICLSTITTTTATFLHVVSGGKIKEIKNKSTANHELGLLMLSVCIDRSVAVWMRVRVLSHLRAGICPVRTRRHNISLIQPYPASGSFVRLQFITIDRAVALLIIASIRPDGRVLHASSCVPVGNKLHRRACEKHERERGGGRIQIRGPCMHACPSEIHR
jgi:hypothetical protein